jgi:hypothetical protein
MKKGNTAATGHGRIHVTAGGRQAGKPSRKLATGLSAHALLRRTLRGSVGWVDHFLKRFGAHRPRRREQEALAVAHVCIEQIDHAPLVLDLVGNQIDAEAAEHIGKVCGADFPSAIPNHGKDCPIEQQIGANLYEPEAATDELARFDARRSKWKSKDFRTSRHRDS